MQTAELPVCTVFNEHGEPKFVYAAEVNENGLVAREPMKGDLVEGGTDTDISMWNCFDAEAGTQIVVDKPGVVESGDRFVRFSHVDPEKVQAFIDGIRAVYTVQAAIARSAVLKD